RPTYEVATGAVKIGGLQHAVVVASPDVQPGDDLFTVVAKLAKRKGQNAIRPDIIRIPLSGLQDIAPLEEELKRRSEEEDPSAGKSALGLLVDARDDYRAAAEIAAQLSGIGAISVCYPYNDNPDWMAYEDCVKAAIAARVPLWLEAIQDYGGSGGDLFQCVDEVLDMAHRAHALGHR